MAELCEELADIERHMYIHCQTSGKILEEFVSEDKLYVITHSVMSAKVFFYSVINRSSWFFHTDDKKPETVNDQNTEIIGVVDSAKARLLKCGVI